MTSLKTIGAVQSCRKNGRYQNYIYYKPNGRRTIGQPKKSWIGELEM